jgi:hypothetical protein
VYSIYRGGEIIGRTRLERPGLVIGDAQGLFEPAAAFRGLRDRHAARSSVIAAELEERVRTGEVPADLVRHFRDVSLLFDRNGTWPDLEVVSPDGRKLNARVDGFAETSPNHWVIGVTVNDAEYWRRAAEGTL